MCGISGYYGIKKFSKKTTISLLENMKTRGPDSQQFIYKKYKYHCFLFHSRLSIIDLDNRSSQPMEGERYSISFNGEIYNYLELKNKLMKNNVKFKTKSDTEVLLKGIEKFGLKFLNKIEGMWAVSILDNLKQELYLGRDPFGEKPLFYIKEKDNFYFGSQINYLKILKKKTFSINNDKLKNFINCGYKNIYKNNKTFFKNVEILKPGSLLKVNKDLVIKQKIILKLEKGKKEKDQKVIISNIKQKLINSVKIRTRSDVPIGFCLSGGIDSGALVSISKKILKLNFNTYSIIDKNKNYNELKEIDYLTKYLKIHNKKIFFKRENFLKNLKKLIKFRQSPIPTISYYVHSYISTIAAKDGIKVLFSGSGADEIFTGYYDHYLLDIISQKKGAIKDLKIKYWEKYIKPNVRNPIFKNIINFNNESKKMSYVYDNKRYIDKFIINRNKINFFQKNYHENILKNRMLNEMFNESIPVILFEDDQNSMINGIENRSPFLDKELLNYSMRIPSKFYIQKGYNKYLLRSALKKILPEKIRLSRKKIGFNFDINNLIDFKNEKTLHWLLNKKSQIFKYVNFDKFSNLILNSEIKENFLQKFVFTVISSKVFIEECRK